VNAWIENLDVRADGTLEYRTTEINGQRVKQEYRVGDQWLWRGHGAPNRFPEFFRRNRLP